MFRPENEVSHFRRTFWPVGIGESHLDPPLLSVCGDCNGMAIRGAGANDLSDFFASACTRPLSPRHGTSGQKGREHAAMGEIHHADKSMLKGGDSFPGG